MQLLLAQDNKYFSWQLILIAIQSHEMQLRFVVRAGSIYTIFID